MGFSGTLQTLHFADILQWCKNGNKTGTLTLGRKGVKKEIFLEGGKIVSAASNNPMEHLGQHLISLRGHELKSKEYFVLSRVNGRWGVRSLA